jgi:hypothetical protein
MADIQVANTDADLSGNTVVTEENAYTITGLHTFSRSTNAPFACISGAAVVTYLDADKLDGQEGTYYLAAANITGTTLASNVVTSSLTAVGTIATGVWQGTDVGVAHGGTGASSLTDGGVLLGSGTGAITAMSVLADSEMIVGNGSTDPVAESGATLRTSIGVGTGDSPTFTAVTVGQVDITAEGDLRLQDNTGGEYVGLDAPSAVSGSYTLTFPAAIGAVDQVLSINNTDGTLQWATPDSGDITSVVAGAGMTGGGTAGDVTLNVIGTADKITVNANDVTIASTYVGQTSITTLGTVATGTWEGTDVGVAHGGTGVSTLTDGGVLLGSGSSAVTAMAVLADSEMIVGDGSTDPVAESGSTLRTSIGCDSASNITSGTLANARLPTNVDLGGTLDVTGATVCDSTLTVVDDLAVDTDTLFVDASADKVYIGHTASVGTGAGLQVASTDGTAGAIQTSRWGAHAGAPNLLMMKSRSATVGGSAATVVDGDQLGYIQWQADDGTDQATSGAHIAVFVDGTPAENSIPTYMGFSTTTEGGSAEERMRIAPTGNVGIGELDPGGGGFLDIAGTSGTAGAVAGNDTSAEKIASFQTGTGAHTDRRGRVAIWGVSDGSNDAITLASVGGVDVDLNFATRRADGVALNNLRLHGDGTSEFEGALTKPSGTFKIDHPLPSMTDTHNLVHSFIEGPKADLIYRGTVTLVDGTAEVDLDEAAGMTSGTWVLLCRDEQCFTSNETGWFHVRGSVTGSTLTIDCEEATCTDTVSWMVVACRKDQHMYDTTWTDEDGYPIIEPLKVADPDPEP